MLTHQEEVDLTNGIFGKYMPHILRILDPLFGEAVIAPLDEDRKKATDILLDSKRYACRMRSNKIYHTSNWRFQFTVRDERENTGQRSEFDKIMAGHGDFMFYGFGEKDGRTVMKSAVFDLDRLREFTNARKAAGKVFAPRRLMENSWNYVYDAREILGDCPGFVVFEYPHDRKDFS